MRFTELRTVDAIQFTGDETEIIEFISDRATDHWRVTKTYADGLPAPYLDVEIGARVYRLRSGDWLVARYAGPVVSETRHPDDAVPDVVWTTEIAADFKDRYVPSSEVMIAPGRTT